MKLYRTLGNIRVFHLLISGLVVIIPIIMLLITLYFNTASKLQNKASTSAEQSVKALDSMFLEIDLAAEVLLSLTNRPCNEIKQDLTKYTVTHSYVRTLSLTKNNVIYCSSFFDAYHRPVLLHNNQIMQLFNNNDITPDRSFLYYHKTNGHVGALIAVDGTYIAYLLQADNKFFFVLDEQWLNVKAGVFPPLIPKNSKNLVTASSTQFPFKIVVILSSAMYWQYMLEHYLLFLLIFSLVMIIIGTQIYIRLPIYDIVKAMHRNQFVPYYQLIKYSNSNHWSGVEVLIRWQHPKKGLIMPDEFIPKLEKSRYIIPVTLNLMQHVKEDFMRNIELIPKGFHISINISPKHLQTIKLAMDCENFLQQFPQGHIQLTLEITEREIAEPTPTTSHLFKLLQKLKVLVSIDDFGTGHASLSYLQNFKVNYIKIDRSFINTVSHNISSQHIVNSIIELANNLKVDIIAEGVETNHQQQYLVERGVKYLQGFLFSKPAPMDVICSILTKLD